MKRGESARPVLKWAGGKRELVESILARLPDRIDTYFEPFVGGGAVFFALAAERRFARAVLSDRNPDLIVVYEALRSDVEAVIDVLDRLRKHHSEKQYYRVRSEKPKSQAERAARIIYLNKTGYNGLYRVNRSGEFNVPFGRYKKPNICDEPNLRAAGAALEGVEILVEDFEAVCSRAKKKDAVYLDPPYVPVSRSANFTAYHHDPFGMDEHRRLARVFAHLEKKRVHAVLSNSYTPETKKLYENFECEIVRVSRMINSRGSARGPIKELLVVSRVSGPRRESVVES
jgi:DNA adenine methylase